MTTTESSTSSKGIWKKAVAGLAGVGLAAAAAFGVFATHSEHFQHPTHRVLEEIAAAKSIQVTFVPRDASNALAGSKITGLLFPRRSATGELQFDGRLSYVFVNQQYNFTLVDGRGFSTVEELSTRKVVRNECLFARNVPPVFLLSETLRHARVVDNPPNGMTIPCPDGKLVEFRFADEPFLFCSRHNGAIDKVHGEDIDATIQLLQDNTQSEPAVSVLSRAGGLPISECESLVDAHAQAVAGAPATTVRRALQHAKQRARDAIQVLKGEDRHLEAWESCSSCATGPKPCLFVHGLGESTDAPETDNFKSYWGDVQTKLPCCSSVRFMRLNTIENSWYNPSLAKKVCNAAMQMSGSKDPMNLQNIAIIAHSMGNLILANAAIQRICAVGSTAKWIALGGPIEGSQSSNFGLRMCRDNPDSRWDDGVVSALRSLGICPAKDGMSSLVHKETVPTNTQLRAMFDRAESVYRSLVSAAMCGVSNVGLASFGSAKYSMLGRLSGHASSNNDGAVEFGTCRGSVAESWFQTSWRGGAFYKAALNHGDVALATGDGWWGDDRKPIKWLNCQL
ncbi:hypothetical protein P43SY_006656 [Pythium insidiosum]|uniref:Uncharacterized protein n=1 Tax=Pythium insidiosum TaxID=114742 RepID=A0AAD5Q698_PYTIN|nr:hypothetical protein P43SY_006656 [Pythium insidiosum]